MEQIINPNTIQIGTAYLKENIIIYTSKYNRVLEIPIDDVRLFGEYTINSHPSKKGVWFLTFIYKDGTWESIPWFTENMQQLSEYLAYRFHTSFKLEDLPKTIWGKSIIRFPNYLYGRPIFQIDMPEGYRLPLTYFDKTINFLRLGKYWHKWEVSLTEEVKNYLQI